MDNEDLRFLFGDEDLDFREGTLYLNPGDGDAVEYLRFADKVEDGTKYRFKKVGQPSAAPVLIDFTIEELAGLRQLDWAFAPGDFVIIVSKQSEEASIGDYGCLIEARKPETDRDTAKTRLLGMPIGKWFKPKELRLGDKREHRLFDEFVARMPREGKNKESDPKAIRSQLSDIQYAVDKHDKDGVPMRTVTVTAKIRGDQVSESFSDYQTTPVNKQKAHTLNLLVERLLKGEPEEKEEAETADPSGPSAVELTIRRTVDANGDYVYTAVGDWEGDTITTSEKWTPPGYMSIDSNEVTRDRRCRALVREKWIREARDVNRDAGQQESVEDFVGDRLFPTHTEWLQDGEVFEPPYQSTINVPPDVPISVETVQGDGEYFDLVDLPATVRSMFPGRGLTETRIVFGPFASFGHQVSYVVMAALPRVDHRGLSPEALSNGIQDYARRFERDLYQTFHPITGRQVRNARQWVCRMFTDIIRQRGSSSSPRLSVNAAGRFQLGGLEPSTGQDQEEVEQQANRPF